MKELILKIKYDDEGGYKGHGSDTSAIIKYLLEREMEAELVSDEVIKKEFSIEVINL